MNPWRWVDPRVRQVKIADLQTYLLGRGWVLKPNPNRQLLRFELSTESGSEVLFQMVPANEEFVDFPQRIVELLTTLSELEDRHPVALLEDVLQVSAEGSNGHAAQPAPARTR